MDHLTDDPVLDPLIEEYGRLELEPAPDPFRRLITSIVGQQLSTEAAATIRQRLVDTVEITPDAILAAAESDLREAGLSKQKTTYVKNVARTFDEQDFTRDSFDGMSDEIVIEELTSIHGVGVWTAKLFLMFGLAREDVFPVEDLGIRRGMEYLYGDLTRDEMISKADPWKPYRSYASLYIWRAIDDA